MKYYPEYLCGYVYVLELSGFYKIGSSKRPDKRYIQLSTGTPIDLKVVHWLKSPYYQTVEKQLHNRFAHKRTRREWFALTDEDIQWIKSLDNEGRDPDDENYDGFPAQMNKCIPFVLAERVALKLGIEGPTQQQLDGHDTEGFILRVQEQAGGVLEPDRIVTA